MSAANDVLPALFLADDPDEVLAAAAALATLSAGEIQNPETINRRTGKPERSGLFCARTFGPVDDDRCLCGKYASAAHRGTTCEKCGVLCGSSRVRGERWGHLACPVGLVHPVLAPRIARALGCTARELLRVLAYEAELHQDGTVTPSTYDSERRGPLHIAERLGPRADEWLLTRVPVTPPAWRGTRRDPQDEHYAKLINRRNRLRRLLELNAPAIILDNERRMTQEAWDRLYTAVRAELAARGPIVAATDTPRARTLLQAVYDDPDSDAARRAYAAHLTREGDLRGEFITSQLANARRARPSQREADLLRRDEGRYLAPLTGLVEPNVAFRRGFIAACKTTAAAASHLDEPAWATVEQLETDIPALIRSAALRSLTSLAAPLRALVPLADDGVTLPRIHTLQLTIPRCPPEGAEAVRSGDLFPGLRALTVVHRSPRGGADWTWLTSADLLRDVERLTLVVAFERLAAIDLPAWAAVIAAHNRLTHLTIQLGKRLVTCEFRRDREWVALRVLTSAAIVERVAMGDESTAQQLTAALTALAPHDVQALRIDCPGSWFGEALAALAGALRDRFGAAIKLPRIFS